MVLFYIHAILLPVDLQLAIIFYMKEFQVQQDHYLSKYLPLYPFPNEKVSTFPNCRSLQTTISNLIKMEESSSNGLKTQWEKEKLLVTSPQGPLVFLALSLLPPDLKRSNTLPNKTILVLTKLKAFAENKFNFA